MSDRADAEQKIIDAVYRGACEPDGLAQAVQLIADYFGSPGVVLGDFDRAKPEMQVTIGTYAVDDVFLAKYAPYADLDPAPAAFAAMPIGRVSTTDRLIPAHELRRNAFVQEFLGSYGIDTALGGSLLSGRGRFALVSVLHDFRKEAYDEHEIGQLERLTPHLTRALEIRRLFLHSQRRAEVMEAVVNRHPAGIIAMDESRTALFVNDAARRLAALGDGIGLDRDARLFVLDRAGSKRLAALQADVLRGGAGGLLRIQRPSGRQPFLILVSRLPATEAVLQRTQRGILIAIHDPARGPVAAAARIAQLLHIPPGAAKVVAAIVDGIELRDYADSAGISINTVRFHLKTAFERTGSRGQTELVRRAVLALSDIGPFLHDRD